jgi:hypothetical protein
MITKDWTSSQPSNSWSRKRIRSVQRRRAPRDPLVWYCWGDWLLFHGHAHVECHYRRILAAEAERDKSTAAPA